MVLKNVPKEGISYFSPAQTPPSGTAIVPQSDNSAIPKLFTPLKIRGMTIQNRIGLSPLCQYSAQDGHVNAWHLTHLGGIIQRGPGLSIVEAASILPEGRITPEDTGLWKDSQAEAWKPIVEFAHSQSQHIGIQLAHAGRKASTVAPWLSMGATAEKEAGGWPDHVLAPSAIPYSDTFPQPKAMSLEQIEEFKTAYVAAVKRALSVGFDFIEIHAAHGYLFTEFLSGVSNKRTDKYGGSFENRTRLLLEVVELVRKTIPEDYPLFVRISADEWLQGTEFEKDAWTLDQSIKLAGLLAAAGVDLLDVSSAGNHPAQKIKGGPGYQVPFAKAIKEAVGDKMLVSTVGSLETAKFANEVLEQGLDVALVGRGFQKNPGLVWTWAEELGVEIQIANQIRWGFAGRGGKKAAKVSN